MRITLRRSELSKDMAHLLDECPWDWQQLVDQCNDFDYRHRGFYTRLDNDTVRLLLSGFLVWPLFTCNPNIQLTGKQMRAAVRLCCAILKIED